MRPQQPPRSVARAGRIRLTAAAVVVAAVLGLLLTCGAPAASIKNVKKVLIHPDGSRTPPVHRVQLYQIREEDGEPLLIDPAGDAPAPFSLHGTCDRCHEYDTVQKGWHFNASNPKVDPGRPGEPWIYVDRQTGTQIPVSPRNWPGTFRPGQVGLTNWRYAQLFGRQMPGGDLGEKPQEAPDDHFVESGKLEINCLNCHNASGRQDPSAWATNIADSNFAGAAAASSGLALVKAKPGGTAEDATVSYHAAKFDAEGYTVMDLTRTPDAKRCYFCHSTSWAPADKDEPARHWAKDRDVHLTSGLTCTNCHRNGEPHHIVRGYEGECGKTAGHAPKTLTCRGCHLGTGDETGPGLPGRLGAPYPKHTGLPTVHFDKLSCTACHSGPWPGKLARQVKTSRSHALGTHGKNTGDPLLPYIASPVFLKGHDGKIAPHNAVWPAYWGKLANDQVAPLPLAMVKKTADQIRAELKAELKDKQDKADDDKAREALQAAYAKKMIPPAPKGPLTKKYDAPMPEAIALVLAKLKASMAGSGDQAGAVADAAKAVADTPGALAGKITAAMKAEDTEKALDAIKPDLEKLKADIEALEAKLAALGELDAGMAAVAAEAKPHVDAIKSLATEVPDLVIAAAELQAELPELEGEPARFQKLLDKAKEDLKADPDDDFAKADLKQIPEDIKNAKEKRAKAKAAADEATGKLNDTLAKCKTAGPALVTLAGSLAGAAGGGVPVYVSAGKVYQVDDAGKLVGEKHDAAKPYGWPIAHDVRPANQALGYGGATGCQHCHATDSPIFFGEVIPRGPVAVEEAQPVVMHELLEENGLYWEMFARSFVFRPMLKIVGLASSGIIGFIVLLYLLLGVRAMLVKIASRSQRT